MLLYKALKLDLRTEKCPIIKYSETIVILIRWHTINLLV
jgi:hypothetical protein